MCYTMVVTEGVTKGESKATLQEKDREGKNKVNEHHFGISASFFGEQEWEKLLEG